MTSSNYTEILAILDRSGSMNEIKSDMEGGFNAFVKQQAEDPDVCCLTLVQFDDKYEQVYMAKPIKEVPELVLEPRGRTALLDAMGRAITEFGQHLAEMGEDERPAHVVVTIMTDGLENASHEWTKDKVSQLVQDQTNTWKWTFLYLGANQDAIKEAAALGVPATHAITYNTSNVDAAFTSATRAVADVRAGTFQGYTEQERELSTAG